MIKILVDLNLSPDWIQALNKYGWESVHWSAVGDPRAPDRVVMAWAREKGFAVFTKDLDFGALLALTHADGPSVIQLRAQDVLPVHFETTVAATIRRYEELLRTGAILTIDESRGKVRALPIRRPIGS